MSPASAYTVTSTPSTQENPVSTTPEAADLHFRAETRRLSANVDRAMRAESPADKRDWRRSVRRAQRKQADARRRLIAAQAQTHRLAA